MILALALYAYFFYALSVIIHELMHVLIACVFFVKVEKICLGNFFYLKIKKLEISPFVFSGYVDVDSASLLRKPSLVITLFYFGGVIGNIICAMVFWMIISNGILRIWCLCVNFTSIVLSLLPIIDDNDMRGFLSALKQKKQSPC